MTNPVYGIAAALALAAIVPTVVLAQQTTGYLADGELMMNEILPPAPTVGDPRYEADRAIFKATRSLIGSERWALATNDVSYKADWMTEAFSCSLGIKIDPAKAPRLMTLIGRATTTANNQSASAKLAFKRDRPFVIDPVPATKLCQNAEELKMADGKMSYDYPSGHTTSGWTWALILAELAPDRATPILTRGRAYGESRFVCGMHNYSAIEAGRVTASATYAAEHMKLPFLTDLLAAKVELDALRAAPDTVKPDAGRCAAEAAVIAKPVIEATKKR